MERAVNVTAVWSARSCSVPVSRKSSGEGRAVSTTRRHLIPAGIFGRPKISGSCHMLKAA